MSSTRSAKTALFDEFARVCKALSSGRRLEIIDILANGERSVKGISEETGLSVANTSQHLQMLQNARLVKTRREGTHIYYSLAGPEVYDLLRAVQKLAEKHVADIERLADEYLSARGRLEPVTKEELLRRLESGEDIVVLDVRPREEYEAGHIPGAVSIPLPELKRRLARLPKDKQIVAYCRGCYCAFADEAVKLLRAKGYDARRMEEGMPEWVSAGLPVESGQERAAAAR